jgi:hypothetical protein
MGPLRIPVTWDEATPAWVTKALVSRHPGAVVSEVQILDSASGTNKRARLKLSYSAGSGPETIFLKAHAERHRFVHLRNGNLYNEARLFRSGVPLPLEHPLVYAAVLEYLRLDFLLVMEDLQARGAQPRDGLQTMSVAQVANGVRALARLHSAYWNLNWRAQPKLRWMQTWAPSQGWQVGLRRRVPTGLERGGDAFPAEVRKLDGGAVVDHWVRYVTTLTRGPMTMVHGDAHLGNMYTLPNDEVGFLDWQVVRRGAWHQDVGYFLVSCLTPEDRRAAEAELMEIYRASLDVPERPSKEEVWLAYRASQAYGLAIWLSTLGVDGYQPRDISLALAQRFASAFAELDALSALRDMGV